MSLFIEGDPRAIDASARLKAPVVELHAGAWCDAIADGHVAKAEREFQRLKLGATQAASLGLEAHAGHGLDYATAECISAFPELAELNIGHFLVGEAIFVGFAETIRQMRAAIDRGRAKA